MYVGLHSFVGSGIDLWNSLHVTTWDYSPLTPMIKLIFSSPNVVEFHKILFSSHKQRLPEVETGNTILVKVLTRFP